MVRSLFVPNGQTPLWELLFEVTAQDEQLIARLFLTLQRVIASPWVWEKLDPALLEGSLRPLSATASLWNSAAASFRAWRRALLR